MKKLSVSALAFAAALVAASVAHAETTPGWYVGAGTGATFGQDAEMHSKAGDHSDRAEDVNLDLLANGGYAWNNGVRVEGEYFHNQVNYNHIDNFSGAGGHVSNNALFGNVLYDFNNYHLAGFTPYVGAGVGPDFVNVKSVGANGVGYLKGDTATLGYQGIAGVSKHISNNWEVTADYRYIASTDPKVDTTAGGQGRLDNASHNLIVGLRYDFGAPMAMAHTAPMAGMHGPAHAMTTEGAPSFTVFFDFNKSVITPEAKRIIASAAAEYKKNGYAAISITGHTDTVGSDAYNEKLSVRRAKAVEADLKKMGVSSRNIQENGVGKSDLLVPTADGVREAQNRRAEIVLAK